jgi:GT2 family glycosyltransferase
MAFWREDILAVNGFDEDYTGWGTGEDSDIGTRLYHLGRRRKFVYGRAVTFHLNHPAVSREHHAASLARLAETIASRKIRCEHGLDQRRWTNAKTSHHQNNLITSNNLDTTGGTFALALIINTFNQPDYLNRVLRAMSQQRVLPDEVLLADDGSAKESKVVFDQWRIAQKFRCEHVWQEHQGFRRTHILNQAIAQARGDYLVFLDGDTIPHPCFIADHRILARQSQFVQGHRALIGRKAATGFGLHEFGHDRLRALCRFQLRGLRHAYRWPWPLRRFRQDLRGVRGCNLAIWRSDLIRVNGYNEAFVGWGSEDLELSLRLMNSGVRRLDVRGWALCYHLWHSRVSRDELAVNNELLAKAIREKSVRCEQGLDRHPTAG